MQKRLSTIVRSVTFFLIPLFVLLVTSLNQTAPYTLHLALLILLTAICLSFLKRDSWQLSKTVINVLLVVLLVGGTGWFLSPFFFLLYLVPFYLGFLYAPLVAFGFLAALLLIFSTSIGEVDVAYDVMTLLSLLIVVPLVIYLRKKYLVLRQSTKDILILEDESGIKNLDTIGQLLANRVTNLGVTVRQPLTYIKQAATVLLEEDLEAKEKAMYIDRIRTTADETLNHIRTFEGETSANEVLRNEKMSPLKRDKK